MSSSSLRGRLLRACAAMLSAITLFTVAACGSAASDDGSSQNANASASSGDGAFPVSIKHAYGTTEFKEAPKRIATVGWGTQDILLDLGVVPVSMPKQADFGVIVDGMLPWTKEKLEQMGVAKADMPQLHEETDGIDFEAIAAAEPDAIIGLQSGMTEEDYETLSKIAPTVAWQVVSWGDPWRGMTKTIGQILGKTDEADKLIKDTERTIADEAAKYPAIKGKTAAVMYFDAAKLSTFSLYTMTDVRPQYLNDFGFETPDSVVKATKTTEDFYKDYSSEQADQFNDVDVIVTYGSPDLLAAMQKDPLLGKLPAVQRGSVAVIDTTSELGNALDPTPLIVRGTAADYAKLLGEAAAKVDAKAE